MLRSVLPVLVLALALALGCLAAEQCSLVGTWEGTVPLADYHLIMTLQANGTAEVTSKWTTTCYEESAVQNQCTTYMRGTYTATPTVVVVDLTCDGGSGGDCCPCEGGFTLPCAYGDWSQDCDEVTISVFGEEVRFTRV